MTRGAREARSSLVKPTPKQEPPTKRDTRPTGVTPLAHDLATRPILASAADGTRSPEPEPPTGLPDPVARTGGGGGPGDEPTPRSVQMKLTVGPPGDPLEQEADRTAARASSGRDIHAAPEAAPIVSRASFRSGSGQAVNASLDSRIRSPNGGRPLPEPVRDDMETMFNADFSAVRVHDDEQDRADSESLGAQAFTHKEHIWLGRNGNVQDRGLLAHELTHVIQQGTDVRRESSGPADSQLNNVGENEVQDTATIGGTPDIQAAWYNFSIPFTDYEFDPSISGIKTAAGVVKDAAVDSAVWVKDQVVAGLEWVYERIKDHVMTGVHWLEAKYAAIKEFAKSSFDTINDGLKALLERVTSPAEFLTSAVKLMNGGLLATAWNLLKSGVTLVWKGIKTTIDSVLSIGTGLWDTVSGFVSGLFDTLDGIFDSWAFGMLPKSVQSGAWWLYNKVRVLWEEIRDFITDLLRRLREYADRILGGIERFVKDVTEFAIDTVISTVKAIADAWEFIETVAADPIGYIRPHIDKLAAELNAEAPPKANEVVQEKIKENFGAEPGPGGPDFTVQRLPDTSKPARSRAGGYEVSEGLWKAIKAAWSGLNIGQMLLDTIVNMFWPPATIRAIRKEFRELWDTDWASTANKLFTPRWEFPEIFADLWSNLLILLDFPIALWRRVNSALMLLMGYVTILLVIIGAIVGGIVTVPIGAAPGVAGGALLGLEAASALGLILLESYLAAESVNVIRNLLELYSTPQTDAEKDRDYVSVAASALGMALALLLVAILWFVSAVVDGVISLIKSFKAKPPVTPPAGGTPPPAPPAETAAPPAETAAPPAETAAPPAETPTPRMQEPIREMESGQKVEFGPRHAEALRQNAAAATAKWLKILETQGRAPWASIRAQMGLSRWRFLPEAPEAAAILRDALSRLPAGPERVEMLGMLERWMKGGIEPATPAVEPAPPVEPAPDRKSVV